MVNLISNSPEEMIINDQLLEGDIKRILGNGNGNGKKGKKFAVLLCAEDSEYVKKKYGGYFGVFVRMLGEEGSCSDAHSNHLWIIRLLNLLITLDSFNKKVLGICFGHQILGRSLGGKIGRASTGWDIGLRTIRFSPSSNKLLTAHKIPAMLNIIECHQDEVLELPPKVEVIGRSNKTSIEMFKYGDHMMGIQGHPEYNKDILLHLIDRLLQRKLITEAYANEMRVKLMESHDPDKEAWRKLCVNFLKGRL
ncbi:unnamed protein product [Amaranthus hypochondriacus]